ncbi:hypothetical protein N7497_004491 [Penicillium chrysogenum]|uniref:BCS1 N-terminal domain-containing protein n=1 Tax=Penicillium chrysogenum TaxID=5076 RepID=A0ABQ8WB67_PENCH|nr:hypothetical protein N7505_008892 [Penicillium chrysogenum]KAJ5278010.1 hypothetical protein N7524_004163 [Penicillium chrysogenum]KAJ6159954.1 hypothetical protein N7497_004491 [Penicillium chrysogenum]
MSAILRSQPSTSSTEHFLGRFAITVRIDEDGPLNHHLLRWMMDHRPPSPRFCSLLATSKSKIPWADEDDALNSVKGAETQDTKFVNYRYIVNQPPISLQPFQDTHTYLFQHHGKRILFHHIASKISI